MGNFAFLKTEWRPLFESATKAERLANFDPRASCFYARYALEQAVNWVYTHDASMRKPYQDSLAALLQEPSFVQAVGTTVVTKAKLIKDVGNAAVHSHRSIETRDSQAACKELFHVCYWLARTYARGEKPAADAPFNLSLLPQPAPGPRLAPQSPEQLKKLEAELAEKDQKLAALLEEQLQKDDELKRLRDELAALRIASSGIPDDHDYTEEETRNYFIDLLLKEAGWPLTGANDREFELQGMPNSARTGRADYVLWGDDGKPLGVVEAKRSKHDPVRGQQQAKLYADSLEKQFGQRPVIFYTNGYEHWIWDDVQYPPRPVQGFYRKAELELLIRRRTTRQPLSTEVIDATIVERFYQSRAIRRIGETLELEHRRRALVVMATGAGKTRTVIALVDLLMRCNWVKRVLFLADRVALVKQAVNAFKKHLPSSSPVNLVTERNTDGRVYVSTYPTMMGLIDELRDGERRFGVGYFDLVIIDEAHRSVYQKYGAIFRYFDALLVGLTATPKDEVDRNTYSLFELEPGVPTDVYSLGDAVEDHYLVRSTAVSVPLRFPRLGIRYDQLSDDEKEHWDSLEWSDDGSTPEEVDAGAVNEWLFNQDTVDKVLEVLMTRGQHVAGGDRLGKTIIFAKNNAHAQFIQERFDANYPHLKGAFARVITHTTEYAQNLIDTFSEADKVPHIAISVDMLDTGIDVPEVLNLVFFKRVRSKTKFWQMVGRGTRLCRDVFGPDADKQFFYIFDFCENLEFFNQDPVTVDGTVADSLGSRLFKARLDLVGKLQGRGGGADPEADGLLLRETVTGLQAQVAGMPLDNFVVRPHRRLVERYAQTEAWAGMDQTQREALARHVAPLPTSVQDTDQAAKGFDLLVLRLQLGLLTGHGAVQKQQAQIRTLVSNLEEKTSIPSVRAHIELIEAVAQDEWWQDVTLGMLDTMRKRLRDLIKLIDRQGRKIVYTNFVDSIGEATEIVLPPFSVGTDYERFRTKARQFLKEHEDHVAIQRLRRNLPLTSTDLEELERILVSAGVGSNEHLARAKSDSHGLGVFIRSLVGLDRQVAKQAFNDFLVGSALSSHQIEFINLVVDHLTHDGILKKERLYESPFTDISPHGPEGLFSESQINRLVTVLADIESTAVA